MNPDRIQPVIAYDTVFHWIDQEAKRTYRRISAGIAWPIGILPGYAVILAEEKYKEAGFSDHIIHALAETESPTFDDLFRKCRDLSKLFHCEDLRADTSNEAAMEILHRFNRQQQEERRPPIHFGAASFTHLGELKTCFAYGIQRIADRTATGRKTLNLDGCPILQRCLATVPSDTATGDKATEYPPLVALCMALATLDNHPYHEPIPEIMQKKEYNPLTFWRDRADHRPLHSYRQR